MRIIHLIALRQICLGWLQHPIYICSLGFTFGHINFQVSFSAEENLSTKQYMYLTSARTSERRTWKVFGDKVLSEESRLQEIVEGR